MNHIFVTDVKYRMAVPVLRVLHRGGSRVTALEYDTTPAAQALGFCSNCADETVSLPFEETAFLAGLKGLAEACPERPVVIPVGRRTLGILAEHQEVRGFADVITPTPEALRWADNKRRVLALAREIGVPCPISATIEDFGSLEELGEAMTYPAVVKYQNGETLGLKPAQRYQIVEDKAALMAVYSQMAQRQAAPIAQEYVAGTGFGVSVVLGADGRLCDFICHERLREYPTAGGPSACCRAIFSRELLQYACKLLGAIGFTGVAMVEFKGTLEHPKLMEINPRFWGTSPLIAAAGSGFYESLVAAAQGRAPALDPATCTPNYQVGKVMRFLPQDLLAFPHYLKQSRHKGACLAGYLGDCFRPSVREGLFDRRDCRPFFRYLWNLLGRGGS
ncbi:MAG: ATP-grasp domain-containing protein [Oscillospiraceae bacterium]